MRIFCLNFHKPTHPGIAEAFLGLTPLLHFREPGLLFGEVSKTLPLFPSSKDLLEHAIFIARQLGFSEATACLADTAAGAQALSRHYDFLITEPGLENQALALLPVSSLKDLEGLSAWPKPFQLEEMSEFLSSLGLRTLSDLMKLPSESWNLRWGDVGTRLREKLMSREKSAFTPLLPTQPLVAYHHCDFPVSDDEWLLEAIRPRLQELLLRLEGRDQQLDELHLLLICEYSDQKINIALSPSHKTRDLRMMLTLLRERFQDLKLENPISEWEIELLPVDGKHRQLDFWEPQSSADTENLLRLQSLLHDRKIHSGFLKLEDAQIPEKSWSFQKEPLDFRLPASDFAVEGRSHRELPVYSEGLNSAPRPTQLLDPPLKLSEDEVRSFRMLHAFPLERLELPWLQTARDYWIALNERRQCVWLFREIGSSTYFLHGYFD